MSESGDPRRGIYVNGTFGQLSWDADKLWEWGKDAPGGTARQNHDWQLLPNGNWLILVKGWSNILDQRRSVIKG